MKISRKRIPAAIMPVLFVTLPLGIILKSKPSSAYHADIFPISTRVDDRALNSDTKAPASAEIYIAAVHSDPDSLMHALKRERHRRFDDDKPPHQQINNDDGRPRATPLPPAVLMFGSGLIALTALRKRKRPSFSK